MRLPSLIAPLLVSCLVPLGCSDDGSGDSDPSDGLMTTSTSTTTSGTAEPTPGGTMTATTPTASVTDQVPTSAPTVTGAPSGSGGTGNVEPGGTGAAPGAGGSGGSTDGPSGPTNLPADETAEAMTAFITSEAYKGEEWTAETDQPREASSGVSPHGSVRVYLNDTLIQSVAAGNGGVASASGVSHTAGSMTVKEFYDDATLVGVGVLYKYGEGANDWAMWCYGPAGRCSSTVPANTVDNPMHEINAFACAACHGGNVFTTLAE